VRAGADDRGDLGLEVAQAVVVVDELAGVLLGPLLVVAAADQPRIGVRLPILVRSVASGKTVLPSNPMAPTLNFGPSKISKTARVSPGWPPSISLTSASSYPLSS
jgi:hypothetical protein